MSDTKRKTFQFHQDDLDWINPLILEWADENQDRDKGIIAQAESHASGQQTP